MGLLLTVVIVTGAAGFRSATGSTDRCRLPLRRGTSAAGGRTTANVGGTPLKFDLLGIGGLTLVASPHEPHGALVSARDLRALT